MKYEKQSKILHDALNLLEDDMIEDVEKLRGGVVKSIEDVTEKSVSIARKSRYSWRKWAALAASVCILIGGSFIYKDYMIPKDNTQNTEKESAQKEEMQNVTGAVGDENIIEQKEYEESMEDQNLYGVGEDGIDSISEEETVVKEDMAKTIYQICENILEQVKQNLKNLEER